MIDILYIENKEQLLTRCKDLVEILFGDFEKEKFLRYRRWQDKQAYLFGRLLLAQLLMKHGYNCKLLRSLNYTTFNRPFIKGTNADFSISHSGEYVVCAFSGTQKVGADIEHIQLIELESFLYMLNEADKEKIEQSTDKYNYFFKIWSGKEAILKAHGCGLIDGLDKLEINEDIGFFDKATYYLKQVTIHPSYSSCIASPSPIDAIQIHKVSFNNSLKTLI